MPTADRLKRKRKTENEIQAQENKKLSEVFNRPESSSRLNDSIDASDLEPSALPQCTTSSDTCGSLCQVSGQHQVPPQESLHSIFYTMCFTSAQPVSIQCPSGKPPAFSTPCASQVPNLSASNVPQESLHSIFYTMCFTSAQPLSIQCPSVTINSSSRKHIQVDSLKQRTMNNSGHRTSFISSWKENRPWLENRREISRDDFSFDSMYCTLCRKWDTKGDFSFDSMYHTGCVSMSTRLDVVANHEQSDIHKDAVHKEMALDQGVDSAFDSKNKKEFEALKDAEKVLYFLIKHHLPYNTLYEPLNVLCILIGATNLQYLPKAKNASYKSKATANEFLDCLAEVVETAICNSLKQSQSYGVMIDEYTDISSRNHLAIVGRYIDSSVSKLAFLQDVQLPNFEAQIIYTAMESHLTEAAIPIQNMPFTSDGPSVMLEKKRMILLPY